MKRSGKCAYLQQSLVFRRSRSQAGTAGAERMRRSDWNDKNISGITQVTMTTNGVLLQDNLEALKKAGLDGINISLDTLDREKYQEITGTDAQKQYGRQ